MEQYQKEIIFQNLFDYLKQYCSINKNWRVLEFGVGPSGFAPFYKKHCRQYVALDIEDYSKNYEDTDFIVYDGNTIPLEDGSVDVVVSHSVLEHVSDINKTMKEINRILKVNGIIYLTINPLYYSSWGAHLTKEDQITKLDNWQHLDPASRFFLVDNPLPNATTTGHHLNKLTISKFLYIVGQLPWSIIRFDRCIENKRRPSFLLNSEFADIDLFVHEFRFIGSKLCNFSEEGPTF